MLRPAKGASCELASSHNMLSCQISAARRKPLGTSVCKGQHLRKTDFSPVSLHRLGCHMRSPVLSLVAGGAGTIGATAATLPLATRFAPKRVDIIRRPFGSAASVLGCRLGVFRGSTGSRRGLTREVQGAGQVHTMTFGAYHRSDPRCESIVGSAWNKPPSVARRAGLIVADAFGLLALMFFVSFAFREFEAFLVLCVHSEGI